MLKTDLHTHSIASGHALNTVYEMVREAKEKGMGLIGIVEHGPSMEGAPHEGYFWVSDQLDELYGVRVLLGIEANILNERGEIDLNPESNTLALVTAMQNPLVQIISHPYRTDFPIDIGRVFQEAYKTQTLLELNNQVFTQQSSQDGFLETYKRLIDLSRRYGHPLIAGSDAHVAKKIGEDSRIVAAYGPIGLTDDLLINNRPEELTKWKKKR